jgi:hypothetical protein
LATFAAGDRLGQLGEVPHVQAGALPHLTVRTAEIGRDVSEQLVAPIERVLGLLKRIVGTHGGPSFQGKTGSVELSTTAGT